MLYDDVVYLRKLEETDLDQTWDWMRDSEAFITMGVLGPITKTSQLRWFAELDRSSTKIVFVICLRSENTHVGNVSLDMIDYRHRNARVAICVPDPALHGRGVGSHALRLLMEYAFDYLNLHRLYCKTAAGNDAILRFYQRLGFEVEGCLREHEYVRGRYVDKIMMAVIREEHSKKAEASRDADRG